MAGKHYLYEITPGDGALGAWRVVARSRTHALRITLGYGDNLVSLTNGWVSIWRPLKIRRMHGNERICRQLGELESRVMTLRASEWIKSAFSCLN